MTIDARPGSWRRVFTATASGTLIVAGGALFLFTRQQLDDCIDWGCLGWGILHAFAIVLLVAAIPFGLATVVPFGRLRRALVGMGVVVAALFPLTALALWLSSAPNAGAASTVLLLLGLLLVGAGGIFTVVYRIAR